ncbi:MAG: hypothetical protein EA353_13710 [Puniceicoccaceae bacterium]|nr:MAG: hypothetical protein EA353_13710 [Puniceicoccaceae bacterium]
MSEKATQAGPAMVPNPELLQILKVIESEPSLGSRVQTLSPGDVLLNESDSRQRLWLILDGTLRLIKTNNAGERLRLDELGPGEIVGILSYYTQEKSFFGVEASSVSRVFSVSWEAFDRLKDEQPTLYKLMERRIRESFTRRYRRLVHLHLEMDRLNEALRHERSELQTTVQELERTRERLVHREKLAVLGSVLPGIAHELNNPTASLSRNADYLETILKATFVSDTSDRAIERYWEAGAEAPLVETRRQREQMDRIEKTRPGTPRPLQRRLAAIPEALLAELLAQAPDDKALVQRLHSFEAGRFLHTLRSSAHRISRLVHSLKRYARSTNDATEAVDLSVGLRDTLLILSSRLREIEIRYTPEPAPPVRANEDELNQIWTNLLTNAADAVGEGGNITVTLNPAPGTGQKSEQAGVLVEIADDGPGVPVELRQKIFEPNYTTKGRGGNFGLGLGLGIARTIIERYGGTIAVDANEPCGARFRVWIPCEDSAVDPPA